MNNKLERVEVGDLVRAVHAYKEPNLFNLMVFLGLRGDSYITFDLEQSREISWANYSSLELICKGKSSDI